MITIIHRAGNSEQALPPGKRFRTVVTSLVGADAVTVSAGCLSDARILLLPWERCDVRRRQILSFLHGHRLRFRVQCFATASSNGYRV